MYEKARRPYSRRNEKIIYDGDSVVEIDGKKYYLFLIEKPETMVAEDVETYPELKQKTSGKTRHIKWENLYDREFS